MYIGKELKIQIFKNTTDLFFLNIGININREDECLDEIIKSITIPMDFTDRSCLISNIDRIANVLDIPSEDVYFVLNRLYMDIHNFIFNKDNKKEFDEALETGKFIYGYENAIYTNNIYKVDVDANFFNGSKDFDIMIMHNTNPGLYYLSINNTKTKESISIPVSFKNKEEDLNKEKDIEKIFNDRNLVYDCYSRKILNYIYYKISEFITDRNNKKEFDEALKSGSIIFRYNSKTSVVYKLIDNSTDLKILNILNKLPLAINNNFNIQILKICKDSYYLSIKNINSISEMIKVNFKDRLTKTQKNNILEIAKDLDLLPELVYEKVVNLYSLISKFISNKNNKNDFDIILLNEPLDAKFDEATDKLFLLSDNNTLKNQVIKNINKNKIHDYFVIEIKENKTESNYYSLSVADDTIDRSVNVNFKEKYLDIEELVNFPSVLACESINYIYKSIYNFINSNKDNELKFNELIKNNKVVFTYNAFTGSLRATNPEIALLLKNVIYSYYDYFSI